MIILDGKKARDFYTARLKERIGALGVSPRLAIIQIGDNRESSIYIAQKKMFGAAIGAAVDHIRLPEDVSFDELKTRVNGLNSDGGVAGIIVQMPVPPHLDKLAVLNLIAPDKDVDGLTDENQRLLEEGRPRFVPATAKGIGLLLDFYGIDPKGRRAVVMGRSRLVGHPTAELLKIKGAIVSVCHSQTKNPEQIARTADILIVAIGRPELVGEAYVKEGAVVVDVGINSMKGPLEEEIRTRSVVGDVDYKAVAGRAKAISPVPGGVGPMTVLSLFDNLISSAEVKS